MIINVADANAIKLRAPAESGLGYRNLAGAGCKKVSELVKHESNNKAKNNIDQGNGHVSETSQN